MMPLPLLADTVQAAASSVPEMNVISTAAIAAVCSLVSGIVLYARGRTNRAVTIENEPRVSIKDKWVSRDECLACKADMRNDLKEMKYLYEKAVTLILERDERQGQLIRGLDEKLSEKINSVASGAYEARRRIHETINSHGEQIAVIASRSDLNKGLGNLGKAIMTAIGKHHDKPHETA